MSKEELHWLHPDQHHEDTVCMAYSHESENFTIEYAFDWELLMYFKDYPGKQLPICIVPRFEPEHLHSEQDTYPYNMLRDDHQIQ